MFCWHLGLQLLSLLTTEMGVNYLLLRVNPVIMVYLSLPTGIFEDKVKLSMVKSRPTSDSWQ